LGETKMKSIKLLALAASLVVMVTACGNDNNDEDEGNPSSSSLGGGNEPSSSSVGGDISGNGACYINLDIMPAMGITMQMCMTPSTQAECDSAKQDMDQDPEIQDMYESYSVEYRNSCPPEPSLTCPEDEGTVYIYGFTGGMTCEELFGDDEP
jgi:hypothetical protein